MNNDNKGFEHRYKISKPIVIFIVTLLAGWLIYLLFYLFTSHFSYTLNLDFFLHDKYTLEPPDWFRDFFEVARSAAEGTSYLTGSCANYPPLALLLGKITALFMPSLLIDENVYVTRSTLNGQIAISFFFISALAILSHLFYEYYKKHLAYKKIFINILVFFTFFSYSMLYCIERGNHMIIAVLAFTLFVFTFEEHEVISAVALAVCACLKIYPVLFIIFFLVYKKYKGFLICGFTGLAGLIFPFMGFKGKFIENISGFFNAVFLFNSTSQQAKGEVIFAYVEQHSNSLKNVFRTIALYINNTPALGDYHETALIILEKLANISVLIVIVISIYTFIYTKKLWKRLCIVTCLIMMIPNNMFDYALMLFLPIIAMAICDNRKSNCFYIIALTLLACVPKSLYFYTVGVADVSIQCVLNPLIMVTIIGQMFIDVRHNIKVKSDCTLSNGLQSYKFDITATNVIKGIAIFLIVYFHTISCMDPVNYTCVSNAFERIFGRFGNIGVTMFVFLSSYGLYLKTKEEYIWNNYKRNFFTQIITCLKGFYMKYWPIFLISLVISPVMSPKWMDARYVYLSENIFSSIGLGIINFLGLNHLFYGDNVYTLNQTWWYNSLAILIILSLPLLAACYSRYRFVTILITSSVTLGLGHVKYIQYFVAVILGIAFADKDLFVKVKRWSKKYFFNTILLLLIIFVSSILWYLARCNPNKYAWYVLIDSIYGVLLCIFIYNYIYPLKYMRNTFAFIGKHSGNIFMIYSFIYIYYPVTSKLVYSLKFDLLICLCVVLVSLVVSIGLGKLYKVARWNSLMDTCTKKILKKWYVNTEISEEK